MKDIYIYLKKKLSQTTGFQLVTRVKKMNEDNRLIIEIEEKQLKTKCVDLLTFTGYELGQRMDADQLVALSKSLAGDLRKYYGSFSWNDVVIAFHKGVRDTDLFHLQVKTFNIWLKERKKILMNFEYDTYKHQLDSYHKRRKLLINGQKETKNIAQAQTRVRQVVQSLHKEKKFK